MTSHPDTSPPEPLTADEVAIARNWIGLVAKGERFVWPHGDAEIVARYARALEQHAEAMAEAIGDAEVMSVPPEFVKAFTAYRTQFPRPRADKDATHG
jgi:hypothetical protein